MKATILDINGKEKSKIDLPKNFSVRIREDLIQKVVEIKKHSQPYSPSLVGGKQHSASGKLVHRRHVWQSQYGRGMSRIPRKRMSRKGSQFNWVGAEVASTRGGRRAHPPKILSRMGSGKMNKKELSLALNSAMSATANPKQVSKRYETLKNKKLEGLPFIVEDKFVNQKTKEILSSLKKILGKDLFEVAIKKKTVRAGKGKLRGRKYKSNAGLLVVLGKGEKLKTNAFEVKNIKELSVTNLAKGGPGRLTLYTENAIKSIGDKK